jgi:hypothetical protein
MAAAAPQLALAEADPLSDPGVRAVRQAFPILGISLFDTRARGAGCTDHAASGLVWCGTGPAYESAEGGTYTRIFGYNLDAAGRVVYMILTRREFPLPRDKFDETVKTLGARYGRPATTHTFQGKTPEGDEVFSLVAYWGGIKLVRLTAAEMRSAAQTGMLGRSHLVDHRQDVRLSARQGDPVYKIEGTAGFIAEFRSVSDVRSDYVVRVVYQPAFVGELPKPEAAEPKPLVFKDYPLDPGFAAPLAVIRAEQERLAAIARARRAEEERKAAEEERKAAEERARREEAERKAAEARRIAEERKAAEERARREEEERRAAEARRIAEEKAAAERKIAEEKAAIERRAAEERVRREAAERAAAVEKARREEAERKAAEARRIAEERARREEAERKAAEARRIAEERARLEEAERKAAAERRAIEERFRRAEAEYRASLERAQRAEAERRAAEERARQAEAERKVAEEKARRIEAERKAAEERQLEERRSAERRAAEDRARRAEAERKAAEERRAAEARRAAEERRAAEPKPAEAPKPAEEKRVADARPSAPSADAAPPAARAPSTPAAADPGPKAPPQLAGAMPGVGAPAAPSPETNREEWLRYAVAQSRHSTVAWVFERARDRISDDVLLRSRAIFPGDGRSALEIVFECNIGAGKRLAAYVRAFDERTNAALQLPVEDGRAGVVRGSVTLDEDAPQTAFLFPERGERQASIVEIPLGHDDIRKNTPRAQAWMRHYRVVLKVRVGKAETAAAIYPYADNLRRVLEACAP